MENIIEQFIQDLIKKSGIDNMPEDFKKEYREKLAAQAQQRLGMVALQELDEQGIKDFEEFMGKVQLVQQTSAGMSESFTHILNKK